jgi:hypothetical protein
LRRTEQRITDAATHLRRENEARHSRFGFAELVLLDDGLRQRGKR